MDIIEQKTFTLEKEDKHIVLASDNNNDIVNQLEKALDINFNDVLDDTITTIPTLKKLKTSKITVVKKACILDNKEDVIAHIAKMEEDVILLGDTFVTEEKTLLSEVVEKRLTEQYRFDRFKETKKTVYKTYFFAKKNVYETLKKGQIIGDAINTCRDLVNTPYNYLNAEALAIHAKGLERYQNITVDVYDKDAIEEMNMGAYLGVNKGSTDEPKLIVIKYNNGGKSPYTGLVGKGVMYDTGGYSLKTPTSMPGMKVDMAGAAAVVASIEAIAQLELEANVMSVVAATDNRIGKEAIVPDDILTAANGKTIEVISTDAEGRLTLADALWFAQKEGAKRVIDVATLTGSIVRALGNKLTGAYTNNQAFLSEFKAVTEKTNEPIWEMPITKVYHDELKSKVADLQNKGSALAGASIAAAFLQNFVEEKTEWIHLDIAGTSSNKKEATGVMVKSFVELFA
ncbi:MAG: leucyl aminopeptidase family protein [Candidatus Izemoplasma sp.]|nr:leucyl aminopeptidase family protein [Candidatus Izemoplasma sp.]